MIEYHQEVRVLNDSNTHLSPVLKKSINKIIENEGYIRFSVNSGQLSTDGGNFMSLLKEVNIKGETVKHNKETNLFIKQSLPESDKAVFCPKVMITKEIFAYYELAELFNELQNEFNLPNEERYHFVKCYDSDCKDLLIFDNMTMKGFKIYDRFDAIPLKAIELSVKQIAKFHGFSKVLERYRPDFYENKITTIKYPLQLNDNGKHFMTSMYNISSEYLEDDKKSILKKRSSDLLKKFYQYLHENEGKLKCLCHGDYRMNNVLVKESNGEASAAIPIDYQAFYYGSLVTDFIYFLYMSTDQQFRKQHLENLKKIYLESYIKFLRYFKIEVELVGLQEEFEIDFNNQLDYGLIIAMLYLPFVYAAEDDVPEITNELKTMRLHSNFKQRIEEIVDEYIEWGYL